MIATKNKEIRDLLFDWQLRFEGKLDWTDFVENELSRTVSETINEAKVPKNINVENYSILADLHFIINEMRSLFEASVCDPVKHIEDAIDFCISELRCSKCILDGYLSEFHEIFIEDKPLLAMIKEPLPPQQPETKTEQGKPAFTNNFDNIKPTEIYKHFKAGLVDKGYLTEQELNEYLKAAFELKTIPETLFKIKDAPNKAAIEAVFYRYYKNVAGKIHGKQNQYAALLGNYFEGYKTTTVSSNFSKSVY